MPAAGAEHARQHAQIWKAQAKARERWRKMTPSERRLALRRERHAARRSHVQARLSAGDPSDVGSWAPPFTTATGFTGFAVHAAMLHTGKVLMWGEKPRMFGAETYAWLWDPARGYGREAFREVTPSHANGTNIPIFCSGMSFLADGRVLVVGGTLGGRPDDPSDLYEGWAGLNSAVVFDPGTETWTELPRPEGAEGRWYPSQVLLPDGRTLVVSGFGDDLPGRVLVDAHEIYDPETNGFTILDSPTQRRATGLYPHLFTMPDGTVLLAGPDRNDSAIFDLAKPADPWKGLPQLLSTRIYGNAVLLPEGPAGSTKVAAIGGRPYADVPAASNEMIDLDDPAPSWSSTPGLNAPRFNANTILLPDRSMVTIGGEAKVGSLVPERAIELYDPATGTWRPGPSQVETRAYHSTALLLPDGRVLSTGDERNPISDSPTGASPNETGEIYSPPYLFRGPRPVISSAPEAVPWDVPFVVRATGEVDDAVLIAPSAVTHANDMTQRLVPLATVGEHPGGVTLQSPPSASVAPPGWYMLFVLSDGVPSVATWVRLGADAPAPDTTEPALRLRFHQRDWRGRLRHTGRLRVKVTVDEPATIELRLVRRGRRVGRARAELGTGTHRFTLRARRSTLRWLRHADAPRLHLEAVAVDAAGNGADWTRLLRG